MAGRYPKVIKAGLLQYLPYLSLVCWFLVITVLQAVDLYEVIVVYLIVLIFFIFSLYTTIKNRQFFYISDILFLIVAFLVLLPLFIGWSTRPW